MVCGAADGGMGVAIKMLPGYRPDVGRIGALIRAREIIGQRRPGGNRDDDPSGGLDAGAGNSCGPICESI